MIDYNNLDQLAKDIWLFLTNAKLPKKASIKKESFMHEVTIMMDVARQHHAKEQAISFIEWQLKNDFYFDPDWKVYRKDGEGIAKSTTELYEIFLNQQLPASPKK